MCIVYIKNNYISSTFNLNSLISRNFFFVKKLQKRTYFSFASFHYVANDENEKCFAKLLVNGTMSVTGEQILPQRGMIPKYANLYIGGIPLTFSHYFPHVAMGFIGCMDSLKAGIFTKCYIQNFHFFSTVFLISFSLLSRAFFPSKTFIFSGERHFATFYSRFHGNLSNRRMHVIFMFIESVSEFRRV